MNKDRKITGIGVYDPNILSEPMESKYDSLELVADLAPIPAETPETENEAGVRAKLDKDEGGEPL